jgi:hypothetical protein
VDVMAERFSVYAGPPMIDAINDLGRGAELNAMVKANRWGDRFKTLPIDLINKTLLIVGFGRIGTRVARRCLAMEMTVLVYDPHVPQTPRATTRSTSLPTLIQDQEAKRIVDARNSVREYPANFRYSGHTAFAAIPVRYAFERAAWAEAAALTIPKTSFAQAEAITWFGRAIGAARSGDPAKAKEAVEQLGTLKGSLAKANDAYWSDQVAIQEQAAAAWIALAEGRQVEAIAGMRQATDREDRSGKHVAMENRLSPMRELLGGAAT